MQGTNHPAACRVTFRAVGMESLKEMGIGEKARSVRRSEAGLTARHHTASLGPRAAAALAAGLPRAPTPSATSSRGPMPGAHSGRERARAEVASVPRAPTIRTGTKLVPAISDETPDRHCPRVSTSASRGQRNKVRAGSRHCCAGGSMPARSPRDAGTWGTAVGTRAGPTGPFCQRALSPHPPSGEDRAAAAAHVTCAPRAVCVVTFDPTAALSFGFSVDLPFADGETVAQRRCRH